ncbi:kelch domain-containing protein 3-like isoform X2 [Centruroides vittatus]|uniref:kelch domain-containing protein 3-like isoform X2 n=1 Tax=Centruroides vittatus TaxID=120091 RepID=UPI003510037B
MFQKVCKRLCEKEIKSIAHWIGFNNTTLQYVNHAAVEINGYIYSFGGYNGTNTLSKIQIEVHILITELLIWKRIEYKSKWSDDDIPLQCYGHTVVAYKNNAYIWGGNEIMNDNIYCFNTDDFSWSCLKTRGKIPPSRDGHTACVTDDYMYICGGFLKNLSSEFLEVYQLNFITLEWEYLYIKNNVPYWKDFHSAVFIDKKMYLFGGQQLKRKQNICSNELIYLDTETMTWNYLNPKGNVPQGRRSHSASDNTWELVRTIGKGPSPRRRQSCCIICDRVVIFGGASPKTPPSATFSLETNNFIDKYFIYHDDIFMLNLFLPLKTLSIIKIINENIDISKLPELLRKEIFKYCKNQHECTSYPLFQ